MYKMRHLGSNADRAEVRMYLRGKTELPVLIGTNVIADINRVLTRYFNNFFYLEFIPIFFTF